MGEKIEIRFDKLYRYDRIGEPCGLAIPVREGLLYSAGDVRIRDGQSLLPSQTKVTSRHRDGSVRFLYTRFLADLPGNAGKTLSCELGEVSKEGIKAHLSQEQDVHAVEPEGFVGIKSRRLAGGWQVDCGGLAFALEDGGGRLFAGLQAFGRVYQGEQFAGPFLRTDQGEYRLKFGPWRMREPGPVCASFENRALCLPESGEQEGFSLICRVTAFAGKPWLDISLRLENTTGGARCIESFWFGVKRSMTSDPDFGVPVSRSVRGADSTGCGDGAADSAQGDFFFTVGVKGLEALEEKAPVESVRTCAGRSNYKTFFTVGRNGAKVGETADADLLLEEANEHFGEVFYGTFFGDVTDRDGGVCATIFQAQQNFPKAVTAQDGGVCVLLVPEGVGRVEMAPGMSREQRFLLHFHHAGEPLCKLDDRSLIYQMPDMPLLSPEVYQASGVFQDVFLEREKRVPEIEIALTAKADTHARCYGMMNWGDTPDQGYTDQGRGGGRLVWSNNEYDYPHAMYLMYVRTGVRRFLDYANVAAAHWMDVDVCHHSSDPLRQGGQWEHTFGHCAGGGGVMVCSHQWVEGLLDCYHFTGDERALETAVGIGENILRLLETPMYQVSGESNARETGWALRTLTALYVETGEEKWTAKCRWILGHFEEWVKEYGEWVAPYTDNTLVRVGFMISVAVGSLMRYFRVFGGDRLREMILSAVEDLAENCLLENGLFYYKELPSLARNGSNTLLLEAMAIGYELTGEKRFLEYGKTTFEMAIRNTPANVGGGKKAVEDAVISGTGGTKQFAQSFIPLAVFYKALAKEGMLS